MATESESQLRARVDLVVVPVSVRDNNGNLLTDLAATDFSVFEDGTRQTISNFSVDVPPLSIAIVFDNGMGTRDLDRAVDAFPQLLAGVKAQDEVALFRYDHSVWRLADFSNETREIEQRFTAVQDIASQRPPDETIDPIEDTRPGWLRFLGGIFKSASNGPTGRGTGIPTVDQRPSAGRQSRVLHSAVYEAAAALRERSRDRRKVLIVISDDKVDEQRPRHSYPQNKDFLLQNDIQVYAVAAQAALLEGPFRVLAQYTSPTGGDIYGGRSEADMQFAFGRIMEEAHKQYVLGYVSNQGTERAVFRRIKVTSGESDQGRIVTHRQGYLQYP
jgi:VWFA-related protein